MDMLKLDAPLAAMMSRGAGVPGDSVIDVSVRTCGPLTSEQAAELSAIGIKGADTKRTIFSARISREAVRVLASKPWISRVSLVQELKPLKSGESR
jgi:hypothetical protein